MKRPRYKFVCPKCGCRKFRNVGQFGHYVDPDRKFHPLAVYVECVRCEELVDRLGEKEEKP